MAPRSKDSDKLKSKHYFSSVDSVKAKLAAKLDTYVELHEVAARNAAKRGDASPVQWLLSHVAVADSEGVDQRPIASSVDAKTSQDGADKGTGIQIVIGGFPSAQSPQLTPATIDITPKKLGS